MTLTLTLTKRGPNPNPNPNQARERCEALRRQIAQLGEDTAAAAASVRALQTERAQKAS